MRIAAVLTLLLVTGACAGPRTAAARVQPGPHLQTDEFSANPMDVDTIESADVEVVADNRDIGWDLVVFEPQLRVFFDRGTDDEGEIDIFQDGGLTAAVSLAEFTYMHDISPRSFNAARKGWAIGPAFGIGLTAPASTSSEGMSKASGAPVLLLSAGIRGQFQLQATDKGWEDDDVPTLALEVGYAYGVTADENVDNSDDSAIYVGFTVDL